MDRVDIRKYQLSQLGLLSRFDSICHNLKIDYFIVYGTLLGAVRHKGFIPWDADIDVALHRKDYEKLKNFFHSQPEEGLFYQDYDSEKYHFSPHAVLKICGTHVVYKSQSSSRYHQKYDGIYIDIFPIDTLTNNKKLREKQAARFMLFRRIIDLKAAPVYGDKTSKLRRMAKKYISFALSPISFHYLNSKADKYMKMYNNEDSDYVVIFTNPKKIEKYSFPKTCFGKPQRILFEGNYYSAPSDIDTFLSIHYGDYMKLPPEEERWDYLENVVDYVVY